MHNISVIHSYFYYQQKRQFQFLLELILLQMGIKTSFITNCCTQIKMDLTEKNLLSLQFQRVDNQHQLQQLSCDSESKQFYQHYHSKKLYKLEMFRCLRKDTLLLNKALNSLQMIKNDHICNILFSSMNTSFPNIIYQASEFKVFTEYSSSNLLHLISEKQREKEQIYTLLESQSEIIPFTNTQISNFIHSLSGIMSQISKLCLPVDHANPKDFLLMPNQNGKIKYNINFQQLLNPNHQSHQNGYFSSQTWLQHNANSNIIDLNQTVWHQRYQKNLIFAFGMIILHLLLLQPCDDCYNYKSKQFCKSQLQKKLSKVSRLLQKRLENRSKENQNRLQENEKSNDTSDFFYSDTYLDRLKTVSSSDEQNQPFEVVLYEMIEQMLCEDKTRRISVNELKFRSRKLMQKVRSQITLTKQENTFTSNIYKAHNTLSKIRSIKNDNESQTFGQIYIKKTISNQQNNTTASILRQQKSKSTIKHLKSKRASDREKSFILNEGKSFITDKQNVIDNSLQNSGIKNLKGSIRKLSGYKKVKISENSFIQGFFQNNKAHGLGKITRKNGQVIECIFHNNQIIEEIPLQWS